MCVSLQTDLPAVAGELCEEIRLFLDVRRIEYVDAPAETGIFVRHCFVEKTGVWQHDCTLWIDGLQVSAAQLHTEAVSVQDVLEHKKIKKRGAKQCVFNCLMQYYQKQLPWGSLTGIRPTKLHREMSAAMGEREAERTLREDFCVSGEKLALLRRIAAQQAEILRGAEQGMDVYIGIPFCATRCAYCSFASGLATRDGALEHAYVDALLHEMRLLAPVLERAELRSVYVGGGTPSALPTAELARVLDLAGALAGRAKEFTVEAGRPDTMTEEKLACIRAAGANRISVNAQTLHNATLARIGRAHTAEDFFAAFDRARAAGFENINTDLILGLPGEDTAMFLQTLERVVRLQPESVTLHALAIKRASRFAEENATAFVSPEDAELMAENGGARLAQAGYAPYYLYRQKYMTGNLENVGYALPGKACIYNVDIMEETTSVLAFGAGAISKRVEGNRIERAPAVKEIAGYISRIDEMAERKRRLFLLQSRE